MKKLIIPLALSAFFIQGCATPHVVETTKLTDNKLSCPQILAEIEEAKDFEQKARKERTVTGKNVAAAVLFWPALIGTYANTEEAIEAADERQKNLTEQYNKMNCS